MKKGEDFEEYKVKKSAVFKQFVLFDLAGVGDMDAAIALKGTVVYADRKDFKLRDGAYCIADIIGSDVLHADSGELLGKLKEVINRGATDIYVVKTDTGEVMIPAVDEFIDRVEVGKAVYVRPSPGMID